MKFSNILSILTLILIIIIIYIIMYKVSENNKNMENLKSIVSSIQPPVVSTTFVDKNDFLEITERPISIEDGPF